MSAIEMTNPIKLFFADIDGCLCQPYEPYDLDGFGTLRKWAARAEKDVHFPRFGLCSGRSYAYVEAVAQALNLHAPVLFESGGGLFDLPSARIEWNPALTHEVMRELDEMRSFFLTEIVAKGRGFSLDYGKRAQTGVVNTDKTEVERFLPMVSDFVTRRFPDLRVYETHVSIDVVPIALTKLEAIKWAAHEEEIGLNEVAFIGDSRGDIEAIMAVGAGFAPKNAAVDTRKAADLVTEGAVINGVVEAYQWCIQLNQSL